MPTAHLNRRRFLAGIAAVPFLRAAATGSMPPWAAGHLDIHHLSLGRGVCTLLICPDGTTIMVDAGDAEDGPRVVRYLIDPKPDGSRRPGQWAARYIHRQLNAAQLTPRLDYVVLTHFHSDHMGKMLESYPVSRYGNYRLSGIMDVAETMPIGKMIDRNYPDYDYPALLNDPHQQNYRAFVAALPAHGGVAERIRVGSRSQIQLQHRPAEYPKFSVRNIAANGEIWTGNGEATRHLFPDLESLSPRQYPTENMCSLALRISYGAFDYYTAGDMSFDTNAGNDLWRDVETPAARVAGPVDIAVADHHGYVDATGPGFVRALRPSAFVINAWDSAHPTMGALQNMMNPDLYPGERDVFTTAVKPESLIAVRRLNDVKSSDGHVVFRVSPGGTDYSVFIKTNRDESDGVTHTFGPYQCR